MSKLLDKLEKSQKDYSGKLGFNKDTQENVYPQILIVGKYSSSFAKPKENEQLISLMDGVLFQSAMTNPMKGIVGKLPAYVKRLPWGVWVPSLKAEDVAYLKEEQCDFIISDIATTPIEALHESSTARIVVIPSNLNERTLRSLDDLPVDGFLLQITTELSKKPLETLLEVAAIRNMVSKYLMVEFLTTPSEKFVDVLKEVGIDVILVDSKTVDLTQLTALRKALVELPKRSNRPNKSAATVPQLSSQAQEEDDDDDDEYE